MINPFRLVAHFRRIPRLLPAFLVFSFVASTVAVQAEEVVIKANFSEGDSASAVDGYPGAAGEGWIDSWRITRPRGGETLFTLKVLEEDPLPDQTHYLHLEAKEPQPFIFLARSLDRSSLDLSKAHTFRFTVRLDSLDPPDKKFRFNISAHEEGDTGIASSFWYVTSQEGFWYVLGKNNASRIERKISAEGVGPSSSVAPQRHRPRSLLGNSIAVAPIPDIASQFHRRIRRQNPGSGEGGRAGEEV